MFNSSFALVGVLTIVIASIGGFTQVFAEFPTPYNEWDFDFGEITVKQIPNNPEFMIITVPVTYTGDWELGTATIYAHVTGPQGHTYTHFGDIRDMKYGQTFEKTFKHKMWYDGKYSIYLTISPPSDPFKGHVFDVENHTLMIEKNARMVQLETVGVDHGSILSFSVENPEKIKYNQIVQANISLPEHHSFEKNCNHE